jgi:hypothetical protein
MGFLRLLLLSAGGSCIIRREGEQYVMGDQMRHEKRQGAHGDADDPLQSGERSRQAEVSSINDLREPRLRDVHEPRVSRASIRPSAFGIPRSSSRAPDGSHRPSRAPVPGSITPPKRESVPPPKRESTPPGVLHASKLRPSTEGVPPRLSQTIRKRTHAPTAMPRVSLPAVKADIEELLPITQGVKSLPRPPRLPTFETNPQLPMAAARRFPWASLGVFAVMLLASFAPLSHYRGERNEARAAHDIQQAQLAALDDENDAVQALVSSTLTDVSGGKAQLSAVDRIERALWGEPARVREALLQEAERALLAGDERLAETLFARALEFDGDFDGDDARAEFGLSRARLARGDLRGAETYAMAAIHKRPRRLEYRALHSEILQRSGRGAAAQLERIVVRALAHFSGGTRNR